MKIQTTSDRKTATLLLWFVGFIGLFLVVLNQQKVNGIHFISAQFFPYILLFSILFFSASLIIRILADRKKQKFTLLNYDNEIIRTIGGLILAIYLLNQS